MTRHGPVEVDADVEARFLQAVEDGAAVRMATNQIFGTAGSRHPAWPSIKSQRVPVRTSAPSVSAPGVPPMHRRSARPDVSGAAALNSRRSMPRRCWDGTGCASVRGCRLQLAPRQFTRSPRATVGPRRDSAHHAPHGGSVGSVAARRRRQRRAWPDRTAR